ncbi:MAG: ribonuclease H-like domain-containing protein [Candidatus Pacebacteria bacterium]|nr:ribonuclease H-like domain-containing protein [Candidatus Paceibacterota bacterium]
MRKITFDIETKNTFEDIGENTPEKLDISIVCTHDSETDEYDSFLEDDFDRLFSLIEKADMLIGFNSDHFDIPLLNKHYHGDLKNIKSLDILKEIHTTIGRRIKLDNIAEATLGKGKSGHGLEAITWWKNGEIEKIRQYCLDDVKITKDVYNYAIKNNLLKYKDNGVVKEIKLDTSKWEEIAENTITNSLLF